MTHLIFFLSLLNFPDLKLMSVQVWSVRVAPICSNWTWNMYCMWRPKIRMVKWMIDDSNRHPKNVYRLLVVNVHHNSICQAMRRKFRKIKRKTQSKSLLFSSLLSSFFWFEVDISIPCGLQLNLQNTTTNSVNIIYTWLRFFFVSTTCWQSSIRTQFPIGVSKIENWISIRRICNHSDSRQSVFKYSILHGNKKIERRRSICDGKEATAAHFISPFRHSINCECQLGAFFYCAHTQFVLIVCQRQRFSMQILLPPFQSTLFQENAIDQKWVNENQWRRA